MAPDTSNEKIEAVLHAKAEDGKPQVKSEMPSPVRDMSKPHEDVNAEEGKPPLKPKIEPPTDNLPKPHDDFTAENNKQQLHSPVDNQPEIHKDSQAEESKQQLKSEVPTLVCDLSKPHEDVKAEDDKPHLNPGVEQPIDDDTKLQDNSTAENNKHLLHAPVDDQSKPHEDVKPEDPADESSNQPVAPVTEMLIFVGPDHLMASPIEPNSKGPRKEIQLTEISNYYTVEYFVFEEAEALRQLFDTDPKYQNLPGVLIARNSVEKARLVLLHCYEDNLESRDNGTGLVEDMDFIALYAGWRAACRALPVNHGIAEIILDVSNPGRVKPQFMDPIIRHPMVQNISTVIALKARGPFTSHLSGLDDDQFRSLYVQKALVNTTSSKHGRL